jgi:hypothetical protein
MRTPLPAASTTMRSGGVVIVGWLRVLVAVAHRKVGKLRAG